MTERSGVGESEEPAERHEAVYAALETIFHDVFMRDDIVLQPELTADDVDGWDSFKMIEILISVQETFGLHFSSRQLDKLKSVGDLAALITAHGLRDAHV